MNVLRTSMALGLVMLLSVSFLLTPSRGSEENGSIDVDGGSDGLVIAREMFVLNKGQLSRDDLMFYTMGAYRAGFSHDRVVFAISGDEKGTYSYEMTFEGCNVVAPVGVGEQVTRLNFFRGSDESDQHTSIPVYSSIVYKDLYDGIDLVYYFSDSHLKYDVVVHQGADIDDVRFEFFGVERLSLSGSGNIAINTPAGDITDSDPVAFQGKDEVPVSFKLLSPTSFGFDVGAYSSDKTLVIDPLLQYSTYLGGSSDSDVPTSEMYLVNDEVYVSGNTYSWDFPLTSGAYDQSFESSEIFISKLSSDLSTLIFSTYLGGGQYEDHGDMFVDTDGNVYVTGYTESTDFPVTDGAFNTVSDIVYVDDGGGWYYYIGDAFLSKLSSDGSTLIYSTFIGGNKSEKGEAVDVDTDGYAYVAGITESPDFPLESYYQNTTIGVSDYFILKMNTMGTSLEYSTYLGGTDTWGGESAYDIKVDGKGQAIVAGYTFADDFPTTSGSYNPSIPGGGRDACTVTQLSADGSSLVWSTYFCSETQIYSIALGPSGVYMTGYTYSYSFPVTKGAYDTQMDGWSDAFMAILTNDGSTLVYCTLIGGGEGESGYHIIVDENDIVGIAGYTYSTDFPVTENALYSSRNGYQDGFALLFTSDWTALSFSTYLGGGNNEEARGIVDTGNGEIYVNGNTDSSDYPTTPNAYDTVYSGSWDQDTFITKIKLTSNKPWPPILLSVASGNTELNVTWLPPLHDGNETITQYTLYRSPENRSFEVVTDIFVEETPPVVFSYLDQGLENGQIMYYYVTATNIVGESKPSNIMAAVPITFPSRPEITKITTGDGWAKIEWDKPLDHGGDPLLTYNIYAGTEELSLGLLSSGIIDLEYNHTGLTNGQKYYYAVSAVNLVGEGELGSAVSALPTKIPSAPTRLTAVRGNKFIQLSWGAPDDNGGETDIRYSIYRSRDNLSFDRITKDIRVMAYNLTNLENGQTLFFRLTATNSRGEGASSDTVSAKPIGLPLQPVNLRMTLGAGYADLRWDEPVSLGGDDFAAYNVFKGTDPFEMELVTSDLSVKEYRVEGLAVGTVYYFTVSARNNLGEGPRADLINGIPYSPPSEPFDLEAVAGDGAIDLSWSPPTDLGGDLSATYLVFIGTNPESLSETGSSSLTSFQVNGLKNGKTYYLSVRAKNIAGEGAFSNIVNATPMGIAMKPEIISISRGDGWVNISWKAPQDTGGSPWIRYNAYLGGGDIEFSIYAEDLAGNNFQFTGLENGVTYQFAVSSVNLRGEGPLSTTGEAIPMGLPGSPPAPVLKPGDGRIEIAWTMPSEDGGGSISHIRIYRGTESDKLEIIVTVDASQGAYVDQAVRNGIKYYYAVSAVNEMGEGARSDHVNASPKGADEEGSSFGILIGAVIVILALLLLVVILFIALRRKGHEQPVILPPQQYQYQLPPQGPQYMGMPPQYQAVPPAPPAAQLPSSPPMTLEGSNLPPMAPEGAPAPEPMQVPTPAEVPVQEQILPPAPPVQSPPAPPQI